MKCAFSCNPLLHPPSLPPCLFDSYMSGLDSSWGSVSDAWLVFNKPLTDTPPPRGHCPFLPFNTRVVPL